MARQYKPDPDVVFHATNGTTLACLEAGPEDGPLVLLVHGFPDTPHTWSYIQPVLAEMGFRVVAPYTRGYAPSPVPADEKYDAEALGRDVLGLIDTLGREQAVLVGHDWGAQAVYAATALGPEKLRHVVAVGIPYPTTLKVTLGKLWGARHFFTHKLPGATKRFARNDFAEIDVLYRRWSPEYDWTEDEYTHVKNSYSAPGSLHAALGYYRALSPKVDSFFLGKKAVPTTVIGGLHDGVATTEDFERATKAYEDGCCDVRMLPGGHFLHREHPEPFEAVIREVLGPLV